MNKLAEQLSNDIAIRAAQKLAALNGGMEKDAGIGDFAKRLWQDPSYRSRLRTRLGQDLGGAATGAGAGALAGGIANTARGLMFDKPDENQGFFGGIGKSISDFGTGAILGGTLGGIGGAYKTHNNFNAMVNKANDAKGALRENFSATYGPNIERKDLKSARHKMNKEINNINRATTTATNNNFSDGFENGFWSGMNNMGNTLTLNNPVNSFLGNYNNYPYMKKQWNTPAPVAK